ncbi:hypothetical protein IFM89_036559 [Coptis chinensis]|uniref:Uncharacterized protein n=1 Tax=Coptis chinensis TaxID=261450 RepID=A0A835LTT2_9MAGN|nr:hypothetical protein IFM89_036559 [Coptis chinensis]
MVELKLKETTQRLEQQLAEEQAPRLKAEKFALAAQMKSNDEIRALRESLERAQKETEILRKQAFYSYLKTGMAKKQEEI